MLSHNWKECDNTITSRGTEENTF